MLSFLVPACFCMFLASRSFLGIVSFTVFQNSSDTIHAGIPFSLSLISPSFGTTLHLFFILG